MKLKAGSLIKIGEGDKLLDWTRKREKTQITSIIHEKDVKMYLTLQKEKMQQYHTQLIQQMDQLNEMETKFKLIQLQN